MNCYKGKEWSQNTNEMPGIRTIVTKRSLTFEEKMGRITTPKMCRNHVKNIVTKVTKTQLDTAYSRNEQNTAGKQEATGVKFHSRPQRFSRTIKNMDCESSYFLSCSTEKSNLIMKVINKIK